MQREPHLLAGSVFDGRYELIERMHKGPLSRIYLAWDHHERRRVAVKLAIAGVQSDDSVTRLQREADMLGQLDHPRILRAFDAGFIPSGGYYVVTELLEGEDLGDVLKRETRLAPTVAALLVAQTLEGLEAVHEAGLVHRDVKPENLMLTPMGVMLIDFGVASPAASEGRRIRRITAPHVALGTSLYMAPEQCRGAGHFDGRVDLYACGHVLYELLVGDTAFSGDSSTALITLMQVSEMPLPPGERCADLGIPPELDAIVMKALAKRPENRFQTAAEMRRALLAFAASQ